MVDRKVGIGISHDVGITAIEPTNKMSLQKICPQNKHGSSSVSF